MKRSTIDGTPDPGPFKVTLEAEHPIEIVTEFPKLRFCARIEGQEHTSTFPDQGDEWWVAHWRDFIAVVAKATGRTLHGVEGEDQWWVLDVPLSKFKDCTHREQPRFSIKLLKEMPEKNISIGIVITTAGEMEWDTIREWEQIREVGNPFTVLVQIPPLTYITVSNSRSKMRRKMGLSQKASGLEGLLRGR